MTRIVGHDSARAEILQAAAGGKLHHGWILAGPPGIGKAMLARDLALCLLAGEETSGIVPPNHPAVPLFEAQSHPDYAELFRLEKDNGDLARNISINQVRALGRLLVTAPSISRRRVILIDSADDLEASAANALLKSLEEPPRDVVFLLISHAPSRLLPTIRSRCRLLRLSPLNDEDMETALRQAAPEMKEDDRQALIRVGEGAPGKALSLSGLGITEMLETLRRIAARGDGDNRDRLTLAKALAVKSARPRYEAFLVQAPAFIAAEAKKRSGPELATALEAWEAARDLAGGAVILSLDPAATVFELCTHVAALSNQRSNQAA